MSKAPDKIYHPDNAVLRTEKMLYNDIAYIRKDALLEWAKKQKEETSIGLSEYDAGYNNGRMEITNALIEQIKSL